MRLLQITSQEEGQRLDKYLAKYMPLAPKSFFYKMLRKKNIKRNGAKVSGNEKLLKGDEISLYLAEETIDKFRGTKESTPQYSGKKQFLVTHEPEIIFEDEDILVLNKPAGLLSQKADNDDVSLVEWLMDYVNTDSATFRPGICNRLDRNTSGLVVAGKSVRGLQWMNRLFRERDLKKYYLCLVVGTVEKGGHLSGYLKKDRTTNRVEVLPEPERGAEQIETEYEPLRTLDCKGEVLTLLQIHLITGKSHQIRAHMASIGHPVVGDAKYGNRTARAICPEVKHQLLHAWRLELGTPEYLLEKYWGMTWEAKLPEIWNKFL